MCYVDVGGPANWGARGLLREQAKAGQNPTAEPGAELQPSMRGVASERSGVLRCVE